MKTINDRLAEALTQFEDEYVHPEHYAVHAVGVAPPGADMRSSNGVVPKHRQSDCGNPLTTEQQLSALLLMQVQMETYRLAMIKRATELAGQLKTERETGSNE